MNDIDNWQHRSTNMKCMSCMHFKNMRCRKHAPTLNGWPAVYPDDWCGDHKLDKETMDSIYTHKGDKISDASRLKKE